MNLVDGSNPCVFIFIHAEYFTSTISSLVNLTQIGALAVYPTHLGAGFKIPVENEQSTKIFLPIRPNSASKILDNYTLQGDFLKALHMTRDENYLFREQFDVEAEKIVCRTEDTCLRELLRFMKNILKGQKCYIVGVNQDIVSIIMRKIKKYLKRDGSDVIQFAGFISWSRILRKVGETQHIGLEDYYKEVLGASDASTFINAEEVATILMKAFNHLLKKHGKNPSTSFKYFLDMKDLKRIHQHKIDKNRDDIVITISSGFRNLSSNICGKRLEAVTLSDDSCEESEHTALPPQHGNLNNVKKEQEHQKEPLVSVEDTGIMDLLFSEDEEESSLQDTIHDRIQDQGNREYVEYDDVVETKPLVNSQYDEDYVVETKPLPMYNPNPEVTVTERVQHTNHLNTECIFCPYFSSSSMDEHYSSYHKVRARIWRRHLESFFGEKILKDDSRGFICLLCPPLTEARYSKELFLQHITKHHQIISKYFHEAMEKQFLDCEYKSAVKTASDEIIRGQSIRLPTPSFSSEDEDELDLLPNFLIDGDMEATDYVCQEETIIRPDKKGSTSTIFCEANCDKFHHHIIPPTSQTSQNINNGYMASHGYEHTQANDSSQTKNSAKMIQCAQSKRRNLNFQMLRDRNAKFREQLQLKKHILKAQRQCDICSIVCISEARLNKHKHDVHALTLDRQCGFCGVLCRSISKLKKHIHNKHGLSAMKIQFKCKSKSKNFSI